MAANATKKGKETAETGAAGAPVLLPPGDKEAQIRSTLRYAFVQRGYDEPIRRAVGPKLSTEFPWAFVYAGDEDLPTVAVYRYTAKRLVATSCPRILKKIVANERANGTTPERVVVVANTAMKKCFMPKMRVGDGGPAYDLRVLRDRSLLYNPLLHHLVPEHRLMAREAKSSSGDEVGRLAASWGYAGGREEFTLSLPRIGVDDPICALLGGTSGDVFEIRRATGEVTYRRVWGDLGI